MSAPLLATGLVWCLLGGSGASFVVDAPQDEPAPEVAEPEEPPIQRPSDPSEPSDPSIVEPSDAPASPEPGAEAPEAEVPEAEALEPAEVEPEPESVEPTAPVAPEPAEPTPAPDEDEDDWFGDDADDEPFPEDEEDDVAGPVDDYDPLRDSPEAIAARHWVRGGIVMLSAGGALLVGAILMGASDPCNLTWGNSCQPTARNRAALTMGIPAAVIIAGGGTALGIGLRRRRSLTVDVTAGRFGGGVVLRGRF